MDYRDRAGVGAGAGAGAGATILTSWSRSRAIMERLQNTGGFTRLGQFSCLSGNVVEPELDFLAGATAGEKVVTPDPAPGCCCLA